MNKDRLVNISKTTSWLLRHGIDKSGIVMNDEGYVLVDDMLSLPEFQKLNITVDNINEMVNSNDKQRFSLNVVGGLLYIRANQGHSSSTGKKLKDNKMMKKINLNDIENAYHGTTENAFKIIQKDGIKAMNRKHVHLAKDIDNSKVISGIRKNCKVILKIDISLAIKDGLTFWESDNGVILTEDIIIPKYFVRVK